MTHVSAASRLEVDLWPDGTQRNADGELCVGGVSLHDLALEYGTPLYVYHESTIRNRIRTFREAFEAEYPRGQVAYAGKAWLSRALLEIINEEGLHLDAVSAGEIGYALRCGFPAARIAFHGNNKTAHELELAIKAGVGRVVIDNFDEISMLADIAKRESSRVSVLLRVNPGIDAHTHDYRKTGIVDSKFGLGVASGQAESAVEQIMARQELDLAGFHAHIGSQIFEHEPFLRTVDAVFDFAAQMRDRHGVDVRELSPGGGFGIRHEPEDPSIETESYVRAIGRRSRESAARLDMSEPTVTIEPGRSIVGPAGVAVYTVGARKEIPGVRTYVSVDGGMADNIRPPLYGAIYSASAVSWPGEGKLQTVTVAGKFCESGDVLIERAELPPMNYGDLLALPAAGAYCLAMASNYNMACRPAVVFVDAGEARLVQRRETLDDLLARDV